MQKENVIKSYSELAEVLHEVGRLRSNAREVILNVVEDAGKIEFHRADDELKDENAPGYPRALRCALEESSYCVEFPVAGGMMANYGFVTKLEWDEESLDVIVYGINLIETSNEKNLQFKCFLEDIEDPEEILKFVADFMK